MPVPPSPATHAVLTRAEANLAASRALGFERLCLAREWALLHAMDPAEVTDPRSRPTRLGATAMLVGIPVDRKRGQAFCSLMEALDPRRLPAHGGDATTLIVTVSPDALRQELVTSELGASEKLTAEEVRRLACTARIIPAVLDGKSEVLDLGRSIPTAWCEAHHWGRAMTLGRVRQRMPRASARVDERDLGEGGGHR